MGRGKFWIALAATAGLVLAACSSAPVIPAPSEVPLTKETLSMLGKKGMQPGAAVFVRIFKEESELEVWKQRDDGRFYHFKTYPICNWSGALGPKVQQGDMQAPEGFYTIAQNFIAWWFGKRARLASVMRNGKAWTWKPSWPPMKASRASA